MLSVKGGKIVSESGKQVRLRGVNLGSWLNMEYFMIGFPGYFSNINRVMDAIVGEDKASFFFEKIVDYFVREEDIAFLSGLGVNVVRVPINYRLFERDDAPHIYLREGFERLDRLIEWCRKHGVHVVIDLHAAQGWQNPDWHCDNPSQVRLLWSDKGFIDRAVSLWGEIAKRYRDEPMVAGYDLLNEPVTNDWRRLNEFYRRSVEEIRRHDQEHIVFPEGNLWSTWFDGLDDPWDENMAYHCHQYTHSAVADVNYPADSLNRNSIRDEFRKIASWIVGVGRPIFVGEFGAVFGDTEKDKNRVRAVDDQVSVFEEFNAHWTLWSYKDIGSMGMVYLSPDSRYMKRISRVMRFEREKAAQLMFAPRSRWFRLVDRFIEQHIELLSEELKEMGLSFENYMINVEGEVSVERFRGTFDYTALLRRTYLMLVSSYVSILYVQQFKGSADDELDSIAASFKLENCVRRKDYIFMLERWFEK